MEIGIAGTPGMPGCVTLSVGGTSQTTIDLDDPSRLVDEYTQHLSFLIDAAAPPRAPLRVLHLGAGGLAVARYVAATRPRSYQQAVESSAEIVRLVRQEAPLDKGVKVKIRLGDARRELTAAPDDCYDLVIADVFDGPSVPAHVTTVEFLTQAARVLRPHGHFAANICDGRDLRFCKGMAAAVAEVFDDSCVMIEPGVRHGRRFGNILLFGGNGPLPVADLARRAAGAHFPYRVLHGAELRDFLAGTRPTTDATATPSPRPPGGLFG
ncbi:spermidine synthase [Stackebrandtia albiflava]|uniref:Spermidine synthase n=1 Tax=Stackebrandtia albiflava TaxID=406432 RepID=A0A562VAI9_9ACTN|nr:fused MFS/spermidine synthase [Stackebrandtia albiflava]TWJ14892.1 spermidine synthase [Stackebrandtia albiflava]